MRRVAFFISILLSGCATSPSEAEVEAARLIVTRSARPEERILGPQSSHRREDLEKLNPTDRVRAVALLDSGALAFSVYVPDASIDFQMRGPQPDMIKLARIILVKDSRIVADFLIP